MIQKVAKKVVSMIDNVIPTWATNSIILENGFFKQQQQRFIVSQKPFFGHMKAIKLFFLQKNKKNFGCP